MTIFHFMTSPYDVILVKKFQKTFKPFNNSFRTSFVKIGPLVQNLEGKTDE